jgi:hypothetical protein
MSGRIRCRWIVFLMGATSMAAVAPGWADIPTPTPTPFPQLWIESVEADTDAGTLTIYGENFDNGYWPPLVELGDTELIASATPGGILAVLPADTTGYFTLWVSTGDEYWQNDSYDLVIGDLGDGSEGGWRFLAVYSNGAPLYYEVLEDITVDLASYFAPGRLSYLPLVILEVDRQNLYELVLDMPAVSWDFIQLEAGGMLTVKKGYRWDGPSVPPWYKKRKFVRIIRGSCVHDALYDLMRLDLLDRPEVGEYFLISHRNIADCMIYMLAREDGMNLVDAEWAYDTIRLGGGRRLRRSLTLPEWKYHAVASVQQVFTCAPPGGMPVLLDASASQFAESFLWRLDGASVPDTFNDPMPIITVPEGTHTVSVSVSDATDATNPNEDQAELNMTVFTDTVPPVFGPLEDLTVPNDPGECQAVVRFAVTATDECGCTYVTCNPPSGSTFPVGSTTVACMATDMAGNVTQAAFTVTVEDREPPVIEGIPGPIILTARKNSFASYSVSDLVLSVWDACDSLSVDDVTITRVMSDESEDGRGDGKTTGDIVLSPDGRSVQLRREREGGGNGRVYTIHVEVADAAGNVTTQPFLVHIQHDRKGAAVDDGPVYVVTP